LVTGRRCCGAGEEKDEAALTGRDTAQGQLRPMRTRLRQADGIAGSQNAGSAPDFSFNVRYRSEHAFCRLLPQHDVESHVLAWFNADPTQERMVPLYKPKAGIENGNAVSGAIQNYPQPDCIQVCLSSIVGLVASKSLKFSSVTIENTLLTAMTA
jgi:hypothetical protein